MHINLNRMSSVKLSDAKGLRFFRYSRVQHKIDVTLNIFVNSPQRAFLFLLLIFVIRGTPCFNLCSHYKENLPDNIFA